MAKRDKGAVQRLDSSNKRRDKGAVEASVEVVFKAAWARCANVLIGSKLGD